MTRLVGDASSTEEPPTPAQGVVGDGRMVCLALVRCAGCPGVLRPGWSGPNCGDRVVVEADAPARSPRHAGGVFGAVPWRQRLRQSLHGPILSTAFDITFPLFARRDVELGAVPHSWS